MKLNEVRIGQSVVVVSMANAGRRHLPLEGQTVTVTGVLHKESGLMDVRSHVQGVLIAPVPGIAFKASRFAPVPVTPEAPVSAPQGDGDAPADPDAGPAIGSSLADA